jgi:hypothetical protein
MNASTGSVYAEVFSLVNLHDPNYSIGGHQPRYYDQMGALYGTWQVTSAKVRIRISSRGAVTDPPVALMAKVSRTTSTSYTINDMLEDPTARVVFSKNAYEEPQYIELDVDMNKWFGVPDITNIPDAGAAIGSSPAYNECFLILAARGTEAMEDPPTLDVTINIDYSVLWRHPKYVGES